MKSLKRPSKEELHNLLDRGVTNIVDRAHLEKALKSGRQLRIKLGIDPTGPKIHLGRAITLRKLRAFQDLGHKAVLIVGDFTAQVGDPSDKLSKRPMLSKEQIQKNLKDYKKQLGAIVDLKKTEFHFNSEWLKELDFQETSELAESFSIQQMLERRNFKDRLEKGEEISLRELLYPLMQGYDSVAVKADVELGGFDQLFNLHAGRVIQRHYGQKEQDILTGEMLEGTDGRKMSTSWGNVITIVDRPNDMFGKLMAVRDELIGRYFLLCTDVPEKEIKKIESDIKSGKLNPRDAKLSLAREIVGIYHGKKAAKRAEEEFIKVFSKKELPEEIKKYNISSPRPLKEVLFVSGCVGSTSAAARLVEGGGVKIDNKVEKNWSRMIKGGEVIKAGKKRFLKVTFKK